MLYESFVNKMGQKCIRLVDFFATSLLNVRAYKHAHCRSLLKLEAKLALVINRFLLRRF